MNINAKMKKRRSDSVNIGEDERASETVSVGSKRRVVTHKHLNEKN